VNISHKTHIFNNYVTSLQCGVLQALSFNIFNNKSHNTENHIQKIIAHRHNAQSKLTA